MLLTTCPNVESLMLPSTDAAPKNCPWLNALKVSIRNCSDFDSVSRRFFCSATSKFSIPGPEKNRRAAVPNCPRAGSEKSDVLKAVSPLRGLLLMCKLPEARSGVSRPLLLIPFGMLPRSEVSLLL